MMGLVPLWGKDSRSLPYPLFLSLSFPYNLYLSLGSLRIIRSKFLLLVSYNIVSSVGQTELRQILVLTLLCCSVKYLKM